MPAYSSAYLSSLYAVCLDVRRWAQELRAEHPDVGWAPDMQGMCAIVSFELMLRLQAAGHAARFVKSEFHCFVMVDNLTLDVAATQFNGDDSVNGVLIVDRDGEVEFSTYAQ